MDKLNEKEKTAAFQDAHLNYTERMKGRSRRSSIGFWCRTDSNSNDPPPRAVTPTIPAPPIDLACNADIKTLLEGVVAPKCLHSHDFFVGSDSQEACDEFRKRAKEFGRHLQTEANRTLCNDLDRNQGDGDLSSLQATATYKTMLHRFCFPAHKRAIQGVLCYCLAVNEEDRSKGVMQLPRQNNGKSDSIGKILLPIVPSDTEAKLKKNGRRWLPSLCAAVAPNMCVYSVAHQMILLFRGASGAAFDDACRIKGPKQRTKMNPYRQIAMCYKGNIANECLRVMRPFLNADNCNPFWSEKKIRDLQLNPDAQPVVSTVKENRIEKAAFYLPADEVVKANVANKLAMLADSSTYVDEVHVIWSADHGQGAFRSNLGTVFLSKGKVIAEKTSLVAQIDCKNDTYDTLVNSGVMEGINDGLKRLKETPICLPCGDTSESSIVVRPKLKATGDLALHSLVLKGSGKMAGHHCWRCKSKWSEFQDDPFFKGETWTMDACIDTYKKLESGQLDRKDKFQERGMVHEAMIDCIEPEDWMFPPLHAVDLLTNTVFDYLQRWVWCRIEDVPIEMIEARLCWARTEEIKASLLSEKVDAEAHLSDVLSHLECLEFSDLGYGHEEFDMQDELKDIAEEDAAKAKAAYDAADESAKKAKAKLTAMKKKQEEIRPSLPRFVEGHSEHAES